jgi:hypothetical protein
MPAPPELRCPLCALLFVDIGPQMFPKGLACPKCGEALVWASKIGTGPAILVPEKPHDTAPADSGQKGSADVAKYQPSTKTEPFFPLKVSGKIETGLGVAGSNPAAPTDPTLRISGPFSPAPSARTPQNTTPVPTSARGAVSGAALCQACASREKLGRGVPLAPEVRPCVFCGVITQGQSVDLSAFGPCPECAHPVADHDEVNARPMCRAPKCLCSVKFTPQAGAGGTDRTYETPAIHRVGYICQGCRDPERGATIVHGTSATGEPCLIGERLAARAGGQMHSVSPPPSRDVSQACVLGVEGCTDPLHAPLSRDVGQPYAVELRQDPGRQPSWSAQVRNADGIVAYVCIGLPSERDARIAALDWLRGVRVPSSESGATADRRQGQASIPADPGQPRDPSESTADEGAGSSSDDDDDDAPSIASVIEHVLWNEPNLRARLLGWLEQRERAWEELADEEDAEPFSIALAKDRADRDIADALALLEGSL